MITKNTLNIEQMVEELQERFGVQAVRRLSEYQPPPLYSTGLQSLDDLLGGGLLTGALTVVQGGLTSGRGTLVQRVLASAHQEVKVYLDVCGTFDAESAARCGVDQERLVIIRPDDQTVELLGALLNIRVPLIVLDETVALRATDFPAHLFTQLAQSGSVLLALPPAGQMPARAGARLIVERQDVLRRRSRGDVIGCRSRITVVQQRGIPSGCWTEIDLLWEDT